MNTVTNEFPVTTDASFTPMLLAPIGRGVDGCAVSALGFGTAHATTSAHATFVTTGMLILSAASTSVVQTAVTRIPSGVFGAVNAMTKAPSRPPRAVPM
jgi:hypothetical protein